MGTVKRNGKIELLRFLFCLAVLFFHIGKYFLGEPACGKGLFPSLFVHGAIGVEFFFLVSGYLMAKHALKKRETMTSLGGETWQFMLGKYRGVWFYHIAAWVPTFVIYCITKAATADKVLDYLMRSVPSIFFLQMAGFKGISVNHVEWYLSAMMIGMFLLYPLLLKFGRSFSRVAAPLVAVFVLGYMTYTSDRLTGVMLWQGFGYKATFRAIAELCLGAAAFEFSEWLAAQTVGTVARRLLSVAEIACYGFVFVFTVFTFPYSYELYALIALFVGISLSFSRITWGKTLDHPLCVRLGELSLPIYLSQIPVINAVNTFGAGLSPWGKVAVGVVGVSLLTALLFGLYQWVSRRKRA